MTRNSFYHEPTWCAHTGNVRMMRCGVRTRKMCVCARPVRWFCVHLLQGSFGSGPWPCGTADALCFVQRIYHSMFKVLSRAASELGCQRNLPRSLLLLFRQVWLLRTTSRKVGCPRQCPRCGVGTVLCQADDAAVDLEVFPLR